MVFLTKSDYMPYQILLKAICSPFPFVRCRQYDLRESSKRSEVLIDLTEFCGQLVEAKCLAVNPRDNNYLAVGANGPFVRLYDIRMIHNYRSVKVFMAFYANEYSRITEMWCILHSTFGHARAILGYNQVVLFLTQEIYESEHIGSRAHIL